MHVFHLAHHLRKQIFRKKYNISYVMIPQEIFWSRSDIHIKSSFFLVMLLMVETFFQFTKNEEPNTTLGDHLSSPTTTPLIYLRAYCPLLPRLLSRASILGTSALETHLTSDGIFCHDFHIFIACGDIIVIGGEMGRKCIHPEAERGILSRGK